MIRELTRIVEVQALPRQCHTLQLVDLVVENTEAEEEDRAQIQREYGTAWAEPEPLVELTFRCKGPGVAELGPGLLDFGLGLCLVSPSDAHVSSTSSGGTQRSQLVDLVVENTEAEEEDRAQIQREYIGKPSGN
jgi:hypothetical protein